MNNYLAMNICEAIMPIKDNIDYEDIYDNINDYEYPYNHINREGV